MDESTKAIVATHLTEIVIKVFPKEFDADFTTENFLKTHEIRLNRTIKNILDLYHKIGRDIL